MNDEEENSNLNEENSDVTKEVFSFVRDEKVPWEDMEVVMTVKDIEKYISELEAYITAEQEMEHFSVSEMKKSWHEIEFWKSFLLIHGRLKKEKGNTKKQ